MSDFPPTSRYFGVPVAEYAGADGRTIAYLRRRRVPPPESLAPVGERPLLADDRLDTLAARLLGDPTQFWRLCDANAVIDPLDLTSQPGRPVRVALPEGVPGGADA